MNETISVIIPAYNAATTLGACIDALQEQDYPGPFEIIVVDDGSTDSTANLAQSKGIDVMTVAHGWQAAARNAGIAAAKGDLVCLTDADCAPRPDWLRRLTQPLADPSITGAKGAYATRQTELTARFVQIEYEEKYRHMAGEETIDFVDTYSAVYRRKVLLDNGAFDGRFHYLEDQELSFRLTDRGYQFVFQPDAIVYHRHSDSLIAYFRKKMTIGYWKAQVIRHFPNRLAGDSHTPMSMKFQMLLVMAALAAAALALAASVMALGNWAGVLTAIALMIVVIFLVSTLPFVAFALQRDKTVAVVSPFFLAARALALSLGYAAGTFHKAETLR